MLSDRSVIVAAPGQVSSDLGGEAVILQLTSGMYYSLNEVGARLWELLQQPRRVSELEEIILAEFEAEPERVASDVRRLLEALAREGLVDVRDERAS